MKARRLDRNSLPNIFPNLRLLTRIVLFADFEADQASPTSEEWIRGCDEIIGQGLAGIACRMIRERSLQVPKQIVDRLEAIRFYQVANTASVIKQSILGIEAIQSAGISVVITKGPGIALRSPGFSDRPFIDLDIVVDPRRFEQARYILRSIGYSERIGSMQTWDWFNRFCREAINLRTTNGGSIDLHHKIAPWYWSTGLTFDILRESATDTEVFGTTLPLVAPVYNLLVSSLHIVSDKGRPGQTYRVWRDILLLTRACPDEQILNAAAATGLTGWLAWILGCLPRSVQPVDLLDRLRSKQQSVKSPHRLKMLMPPRLGSEPLLAQLFRLPLANAGLLAAGLAIPSPNYLRLRFPDQTHHYLAWWKNSAQNLRTRSHCLRKYSKTF
jgi:hypothetical protein